MDFDDSPSEAAFRAEARTWLSSHATLRPPGEHRSLDQSTDDAHLAAVKDWQRTRFEQGWAGIT